MKVLHLLSSRQFSGAENVVCQIISSFRDESEYEMVYVSPMGPISDALKERAIEYIPIESLSYRNVRKVVKTFSPDIIHAHDTTASVYASLFASRSVVISHMHVNHSNMSSINLKTIIYLISSLFYKHIFWVSRSSLQCYFFSSLIKRKSSVLYNVIDKEQLIKKRNQDTVKYHYDIVYVGRLTYQKNPNRLIDILKCIYNKYPLLKVAIIGDGDLRDKIENRISNENLKYIDLLGFKSNPLGILADSKLMIMTSLFEGTPMCALEAMGLGTPIVSTPTDGLCELIEHGQTGFLSNSDMELSHFCLSIIRDDKLRHSMSIKSVEKFDTLMSLNDYKQTIINQYH